MTTVSAKTAIVGLIGWPVEHSLSPVMHNAAFRALGLDWVYVGLPVREANIGDAVAGVRGLGLRGVNVTMPHKTTVIPHLDSLDPFAERCGAVNTIVSHDGALGGSNTDGPGFVRFLEQDVHVQASDARVLILGSGGAARALAVALADAGASVMVSGIIAPEADEVARMAGAQVVPWEKVGGEAERSDVIVNATPVGNDGASTPLPKGAIRKGCVVVDLIYSPGVTPLLASAESAGARTFNGLGMLVHQAALSFQMWTGAEAPVEVMRQAALETLGR